MTWVVGYNAMFGYSFLVSDIQITVASSDGTERYYDCCQKIYALTESIAGGFAGSVKIGFEMLSVLHQALRQKPENTAWCLDEIAEAELPRLMREVFESFPDNEKRNQCEIILSSAHPSKDRGDAPWPMTYVATFRSPDFGAKLESGTQVLSIGSGTHYYVSALEELSANRSVWQSAIGGVGSYAMTVHHYIKDIFDQNPNAGISKYYQLMAIERGKVSKYEPRITTFESDESTTVHTNPPVVTSYQALINYLQENGIASIKAITC